MAWGDDCEQESVSWWSHCYQSGIVQSGVWIAKERKLTDIIKPDHPARHLLQWHSLVRIDRNHLYHDSPPKSRGSCAVRLGIYVQCGHKDLAAFMCKILTQGRIMMDTQAENHHSTSSWRTRLMKQFSFCGSPDEEWQSRHSWTWKSKLASQNRTLPCLISCHSSLPALFLSVIHFESLVELVSHLCSCKNWAWKSSQHALQSPGMGLDLWLHLHSQRTARSPVQGLHRSLWGFMDYNLLAWTCLLNLRWGLLCLTPEGLIVKRSEWWKWPGLPETIEWRTEHSSHLYVGTDCHSDNPYVVHFEFQGLPEANKISTNLLLHLIIGYVR